MSAPKPGLPKKILVAVDGSEPAMKEASMKAAQYATSLAKASSGDLLALSVVQIPDYVEEGTRATLREELVSRSNLLLGEIREAASASGVAFGAKILETGGAIAATICRYSESENVDLIVLGTRANTPTLTKMMLGSVAAGVAGNAKTPVLVVR